MSSGLPTLASWALAALGSDVAGALRPEAQLLFLDLDSPTDEGSPATQAWGNATERLGFDASNASLVSWGSNIPALEGSRVTQAWGNATERLGFDASNASLVTSTNWQFFAACTVVVFLLALLNSCFKTLFPKDGQFLVAELVGWARSLALVSVLLAHTLVCYAGTYRSHLGEDLTGLATLPPFVEFCNRVHAYWTRLILGVSIAWMICCYMHEAWLVKRAPVQQGEIFTANDVYTNAMEGMFSVTVRFVLQSCLLLILVFVAEEGWRSPPQEVPLFRKVWNFILALILQLYMVGRNKWGCAWQDMRRLRLIRAVQLISAVHDVDTVEAPPEVVRFTKGDYYVRVAMSIVANGVFHKFVLLSYPIFIFGYIGNADMLSIVKDILAITIVQEIDNLSNPVSFRAVEVAQHAL